MKKLYLGLMLMLTAVMADAQILNPVKLNYVAKKTGTNQYEVRIKAMIDAQWHLYSASNPGGGAEPTVVKFQNADGIGKLKEVGKMKTIFEKAFGVNQKYFENNVEFVQMVKIKSGEKKLKGSIEYMVCNDKKCLPPKEVEFEVKL